MKARVHIDGAIVNGSPILVSHGRPHILFDMRLGNDYGSREDTILPAKIVGELPELTALVARMPDGATISLRGRLVGKQKYFLVCWARHVIRREKKA